MTTRGHELTRCRLLIVPVQPELTVRVAGVDANVVSALTLNLNKLPWCGGPSCAVSAWRPARSWFQFLFVFAGLAPGLAACGGETADSGQLSTGGTGSGAGGASTAGGASGTGGQRIVDTSVLAMGGAGLGAQCNQSSSDPNAPVVHRLNPPVLQVACGAYMGQDVLSVDAAKDVCLNWQASVVSDADVFIPSRTLGSMCPGFGSFTVGVTARFPQDAMPGATASGTLVVVSDHSSLKCVSAPVQAILVESAFELGSQSIDFGNVPVGSSSSVSLTVTNIGIGPLPALRPEAVLSAPFAYADWGYHGEDAPPTSPIAPGQSAQVTFTCAPNSAGSVAAHVDLSPFPGAPAACGVSQGVDLVCAGIGP